MTSDTSKTLSTSVTRYFSGTAISRVMGLLRDVTMAYTFGATSLIAAFMVAYRFAHLMRRLFGESPLSGAFIPHYEKHKASGSSEGGKFFLEFFFSLALTLLVVVLLGEVGLTLSLTFFHGESAQIVKWTMVMLPGLFFISLFGLSSSYLQCHKVFFLTGISPALFNLVWIIAAMVAYTFSQSITFLSIAIVFGLFLQWMLVWVKTTAFIKEDVSLYDICTCRAFTPRVRKAIIPFALGIVGIAASQLNAAIDALFARFASPEGPAYLWYAIRIVQLPIAFIGISYAQALLPALSRAHKADDREKRFSLLSFALSRTYTFCFFMMLALFTLGIFGINLVYGRGEFTTEATFATASCMWAYAAGLIPMVFVILLVVAYQSIRDYKTPTKIVFYTVGLNLFLNSLMVFVFKLGAISVALSTSASSFFQMICLYRGLPGKERGLLRLGYLLRVTLTGLLSFSTAVGAGHFFLGEDGFVGAMSRELVLYRPFPMQLTQFFSHAFFFVISACALGYLFKIEEIREGLRGLIKKISPNYGP